MKLNKKLPKYKKEWTKEYVTVGFSDKEKEVYLVFEEYNPLFHNGMSKTLRLSQYYQERYSFNKVYFFEIFKYLRRLQDQPFVNLIESKEIKAEIKRKLLLKYSKKITVNKFAVLADHQRLIDYLFDEVSIRSKITLVIQKKLGYKYYQNITYY